MYEFCSLAKLMKFITYYKVAMATS
jgi:hypothetical protein